MRLNVQCYHFLSDPDCLDFLFLLIAVLAPPIPALGLPIEGLSCVTVAGPPGKFGIRWLH